MLASPVRCLGIAAFAVALVATARTGSAGDGALESTSLWAAAVPPGGHVNGFLADGESWDEINRRGRLLLLDYPATETTIGAPYYAISRFYGRVNRKPLLRRVIHRRGYGDIGQSWSYIYARTGLTMFPRAEGDGAYFLPFPEGQRPETPIGFKTFHHGQGTEAFTLSCAACHTRDLFGKPVLGGTSVQGGVSSSLLLLKKFSGLSPRELRFAARPSSAEWRAFDDLQVKATYIHGTTPLAMGLENPASVVGLSLAARAPDEAATRDPRYVAGTYRSPLRSLPADTKSAPWWTLKYKNRFLLDGSMRGDPVVSQLIFNEIGRGADLTQLARWIDQNREPLRAMNAAILATEAPRWTDFFPAESINLENAKRGEQVFNQRCARCHGNYKKAWHSSPEGHASLAERLATTLVVPPAETAAVDVGTDPNRAAIMEHLAPHLNRLSIFRENDIQFEATGGYVPPPLVGIWARWPYLHNNSVPNLDELLKPAAQRVTAYYVGTSSDIRRDYDAQAVGFPVAERTPREWQTPSRLFDTRRAGLRNTGHDEGIFALNGQSELSPDDKAALIEFLKTL